MEKTSQTSVLPELQKRKTAWHWYVEWMGTDGAHYHGVDEVLHFGKTEFQTVELYLTRNFGKLLVLDGDPQSSEHDQDIYHEALVHPALVTHPHPQKVLILGGGEGATLREVLRHSEVEKAVMVDIDHTVVNLCRKELPHYSDGSFESPRAELIIDDARTYIQNTRDEFECVISDLTEPYPDTPSHGLLTEAFFRSIKSKMKVDGVFAMQASHAARGKNQFYTHHIQVLRKIWKHVRPYRAFIPSFYSEWGFILASDQHDPLNFSSQHIDKRLAPFASHLRYYDGVIHHAIFTVPKELRSY